MLKQIVHETNHTHSSYEWLLPPRMPYLECLCALTFRITVQLWIVMSKPTSDDLWNSQYERIPAAYLTAICAVPCDSALFIARKLGGLCVYMKTADPMRGSTLFTVSIILPENNKSSPTVSTGLYNRY